jgi:hypothetical protein
MFATGLSSKTAKVGASPLEGGFGRCRRAFCDRYDLLRRIIKDVSKDDSASLQFWLLQERAEAD